MTVALAFVARYWKLAAVALAFALTLGAGWTLAGMHYETIIAGMTEDRAEEAEERAFAAIRLTEQYRVAEKAAQKRVDIAEENHVGHIRQIESKLALADIAGKRLRDELAAANHRPAPDTVAARAIDDPLILRELLANFDAFAGMCAQEVDQARAQISGLHAYIDAITTE